MIIRTDDYNWCVNFDNVASIHIDDVTEDKTFNPDKASSMFAVMVVWFNRKEGFPIYINESFEKSQDVCRKVIKAYRKRKREVVIGGDVF